MRGFEFKGDFGNVRTLSRLIGWSSKEDVVELRDWMNRQFAEDGTRRAGVMHHFLDSPAPTLGEKYAPFMRHLAGDDLTAVLKSHLYLEREMERRIKKHVPDVLKKRPMFSRKIDVLAKAGLIDAATEQMLRAVNQVRNEFGHDLSVDRITEDHLKIIAYALPANGVAFVETAAKTPLMFMNDPPSKVRIALVYILAAIQKIT